MSTSGTLSMPRKRGSRPLSKKILIVGDGQSEVVYFERIKILNPNLRVISKGTGKTGISEAIRKAKGIVKQVGLNPKLGDRIAIVTDLDLRYNMSDVNNMVCQCEKNGFELYLSNPCFEVWLIHHTHKLESYTDPGELVEKLNDIMIKKDGNPYCKSEGIHYDRGMVEVAILNSSSGVSDDKCTPTWCLNNNPSTMIHLLIKSIMPK